MGERDVSSIAASTVGQQRGGLAPWCDTCPLRALSLFEDFGREELDVMMRFKVAHRHAPRGATLVRDGDASGQLYTLFSGWALRHRLLPDGRRQIIRVVLPGDTIGLDGLFLEPPQYSVQAASDVTFCVLDGRLVPEMFAMLPRLGRRLTRLALLEQRALETHLSVVGRCSAEERIAFAFLDIHGRLVTRRLINGDTFRLPITQQQLADFAGLNIIHTNRVLRRLRERGIMTIQSHMVQIHELAALRRLAPLSVHEERRPLL
jgi:CRP-like cAMP-binding protein